MEEVETMTRLQLIMMPHRRELVVWPQREQRAERPGADFTPRTPGRATGAP